MPVTITIKEREKYRRATATEGERRYVIRDPTGASFDEPAARAMLLANAPGSVGTLQRLDLLCEVDELAENIYEGTAKYGIPQYEAPPINTTIVSFDITVEQTKIKMSPAHISDTAAAGFDQRDFKNAIGVTSDGDVEGVEIPVPKLCYTITKTVAEADLTPDFIMTLADAVGCTNLTTFRGFTLNTLLLLRISGNPRPDPADQAKSVYDLTFQFAYSKSKKNINIGNGIIVPDKHGWDYLWVYFEPAKDAGSNAILPTPKQACVERVIPSYEFANLNL